jgi:hypothetical protein
MKKLIAAFGLAAVLALAGCGGSDKSSSDVGQSYVTALGQIADALESVKDEDSAKAAAQVIARAKTTLDGTVKEINSMTQVEQVMMVQKHAAEMGQIEVRISQAMQKIVSDDPKLLDIIGQEMQSLPELK